MNKTALLGSSVLSLWGCGTILGLNQYEIDESGDGDGDGDTGGAFGDGDGDTGGNPGDGDGDGDGDTGGSPGDGDGDTGGNPGDGDGDTGGTTNMDCPEGCDDENDCTVDSCVEGECSHVTLMAGESCSGGVCNGVSGASACVRCLDDASGDDRDSGCTEGAPVCNTVGIPTCTGCDSHEDCADENECTSETCSPQGECIIETEPAGTVCEDGVCNGTENSETCVPCLDTAAGAAQDSGCTLSAPICSATNTCVECIDDQSGTNIDLGCDAGAPLCASGMCVECTGNGHCNDSIACTVDTCSSGVCVNAPNHSACGYNSTTGKCGSCNPDSGCENITDPVLGSQLLVNPAFDLGVVGWEQESSNGFEIIYNQSDAPFSAHSAPNLAWLGGFEPEISAIYQTGIVIPTNAVGVRVGGVMRRTTFETDDDDWASMTLMTDGGSPSVLVRQWYSEDQTWTSFTNDVDVSSWPSRSLTLRFDSFVAPHSPPPPGNNYSSFFLDTLSLRPLVCQ